jgi:hypothetical protein
MGAGLHPLVAVPEKIPSVKPMPHVARRWLARLPAAGLAAALALGISGCASTYKVEINSITNPEIPNGTTYVLTTADPNLPDKDFNYPEVADRVRTALAAKGMYEAPSPNDADIVVTIEYGARAPTTKTTTVQSTQVLPADPLGMGVDPLTGRPYPNNMGNNSITIGGNPSQGQYGQYPGSYPYPSGRSQTVTTSEERTTVVSEKFIRLTARENVKPRERAKKKPAQVWIVEAIIEDEDSDVQECMPPMVSAMTDFIGVSSGGKQTVVVSADVQ